MAPLSRSQKGRVVRSQSLARDDWGRDTENLRTVVVEKKGRKLIKINDNKEVQETAC